LGDKWVISGIESNKPIPILRKPEQYRGATEREGDTRGALWVSEIGLADDIDVLGSFENGDRLD